MKLALLAVFLALPLFAQNPPASGLQPVSSPTPGGACTTSQPAFYSTADQKLYTCSGGVWTASGGGTGNISGTLTATYLPGATGTTSLGNSGVAYANNTIDGIQVLNAIRLGADPTNTNDSTSAIQATVTAACAQSPSKARVYIPRGTYKVGSAAINVTCSNLELFGDGVSTVIPVSLGQTFTPVGSQAGAGVIQGNNVSNIYIHDIFVNGSNTTIDGSDPTSGTQRAVSFSGGANIRIQRMNVNGMQSENIFVENGTVTNVQYLDNIVTNARFDALDLNFGQVTGPPVTGSDNVISGNYINGAGDCIEGPAAWTVITNNVCVNSLEGLVIWPGGSGVTTNINQTNIAHNVFRGINNTTNSNGVTLAGYGVTFANNDISQFGGSGVLISAGAGGTQAQHQLITENILHNNGQASGGTGADLWVNGLNANSNTTISGNKFIHQGSTTIGVLVSTASNPDVVIQDNSFSTGYTTTISDANNQALLAGNHTAGSLQYGISGPSSILLTPTGGTIFQNVSSSTDITSFNNSSGTKIAHLYISGGNPTLDLIDPTGSNILRLGSGNGFAQVGSWTNEPLLFYVNSAEAGRFQSAGQFLVKDTTDNTAVQVQAGNGFTQIGSTSNTQLILQSNGANRIVITAAGLFQNNNASFSLDQSGNVSTSGSLESKAASAAGCLGISDSAGVVWYYVPATTTGVLTPTSTKPASCN